jgi:hypothetical protein
MREFKDSITGKTQADDDEESSPDTVAQQAGLPSAQAPQAPAAPTAPETVTAEPVDADPAAPPRS